ncbi:unnamed protein product, partial [Cylicostephanus goldi]
LELWVRLSDDRSRRRSRPVSPARARIRQRAQRTEPVPPGTSRPVTKTDELSCATGLNPTVRPGPTATSPPAASPPRSTTAASRGRRGNSDRACLSHPFLMCHLARVCLCVFTTSNHFYISQPHQPIA